MQTEKLEYFEAIRVKKYWKNQVPPKDFTKKFVDPYFPPNKASLLGLDKNGDWIDPINGPSKAKDMGVEKIEWKSVSEVLGKYLLFDHKIEFDDIKQGNLGNCYFLSAIAALSEMPQLIYQIFRTTKENWEGYYEIVLFIDGEWQIVFVDDYLPFEKGTGNFIFSKPNGLELWAVLLEKAWAKVNGSYLLTIAGWPSDPLSALTGFSSEKIVHKEYSIEEIWNIVLKSDQNDNIMCTSTKNDGTVDKVGLVTNHAYTLIGAKEVINNDKRIRLVRIRNPWGYKEWNGDWSDHSPLWDDKLRKEFDFVGADDGSFYMSVEDFCQFYEFTHICHIMYHSFVKSVYLAHNNLKYPQVLNMYLDRDCQTTFSLIFKHWRYNRDLVDKNHPATILVARYDETGKLADVDGVYSSVDSLEYFKLFKKGYYVIWIYVCLEKCENEVDQVFFRCISHAPFRLVYVNEDKDFKVAKKILIEGIREKDSEKYKKDPTMYMAVENQFKKTGIGYRVMFNKGSQNFLKLDCDGSKIENCHLLAPFSGKQKFSVVVPPKDERIIIGIREKTYSTFWFNLAAKYSVHNGKVSQEVLNEGIPLSLLFEYLHKEFKSEPLPTGVPYYDYMTISREQSKTLVAFDHIEVTYSGADKLSQENPNVMRLVLACTPSPDEKLLRWNKAIVEGGYYMGQVNRDNKRQGRGAFVWSEGTTFVGHWEDGLKKKGRFFYPDGKVFYDGEFKDGVKNGKGMQLFRDGGKYLGQFENDKRNGKGTFYWPDGTSWEGTFVDGVFHGKGIFSSPGEEPFEVVYSFGKIAEPY